MDKKKLSLIVIFLLGFFVLFLQGSVTREIKLRFFEGVREGMVEPPRLVTSSYLQSTVTASIKSKFKLEEVQKQIKKVFNLKEVRLMTEADLKWNSRESDKIYHIFRLDSKEYLFLITPTDQTQKNQFRIEVFEQSEKAKNNLLDTEFILPEEYIAVFGFEDKQGKPYFLSLHKPKKVLGGIVGGVLGGVVSEKEFEDFAKGAVKAEGKIKPPRLLKKVEPKYPEEARKAGVEGVVILSVRTDKKGNIENVMVLRSIPLLNEAAIDAIKQWKYEPLILDGKPCPVVFTVTVVFKLK